MSIDFVALMPNVARALLGEPNRELSNKSVLRYGSRGSLAIYLSKGTFYDFEKGDSGGVLGLIQREQSLDKNGAVAWLVDVGLISGTPNGAWRDQVVASYNYCDASGKLLYTVARLEPKDFRQHRPHPTIPNQRIWALKAGTYVQHTNSATDWYKATDARTPAKGWTKSVVLADDVVHGLYNLPAVLARDLLATVYLAEGEKDCDALGRIGLLATTNSGGAKFWAARHAELLRGADVVLLTDNDATGHERGNKIAASLTGKARRVRVLDIATVWPECPLKGDVTDWLRKGGGTAERLAEIVESLPDWEPPEPGPEPPRSDDDDGRWPDWDKKNSCPAATFTNACVALRRLDLDLYYDECRYRMMGLGKDLETRAGNVSDVMSLRIRRLVRDKFGFDPGKDATNDAIIDLAHDNKRHPFRDWVNRLIWDGKARLGKLFVDYFNVTDNAYHQAMSRIFLIAAVRRVRKPGTAFDLLPLLESPQGWEKSNGVKALVGGEYHSDQNVWRTRDTKRQMEMMEGVVVFELGELQGLSESNMDEIKTFASRTIDADRMAYGRFKDFRPRQCVFIGTTNRTRYLLDATGNRRFEPMKVNKPIDVEAIKRDREQLWAEAAFREAAGESIALPQELWAVAAKAQHSRMIHDPWEDKIAAYLDDKDYMIEKDAQRRDIIRSADLLENALKLTTDRSEPKHTHRLGNIMRDLGWEGPFKIEFAEGRAKGYRRTPKPENSQTADLADSTE